MAENQPYNSSFLSPEEEAAFWKQRKDGMGQVTDADKLQWKQNQMQTAARAGEKNDAITFGSGVQNQNQSVQNQQSNAIRQQSMEVMKQKMGMLDKYTGGSSIASLQAGLQPLNNQMVLDQHSQQRQLASQQLDTRNQDRIAQDAFNARVLRGTYEAKQKANETRKDTIEQNKSRVIDKYNNEDVTAYISGDMSEQELKDKLRNNLKGMKAGGMSDEKINEIVEQQFQNIIDDLNKGSEE
jgi:hypothetical protein